MIFSLSTFADDTPLSRVHAALRDTRYYLLMFDAA